MQNKTYKNFIERILKEDKITSSSVGKLIKNSNDFSVLIDGGFIEYIQATSGGGSYCVKNRESLEEYYHKKFPAASKNEQTAIDNVHTFRDTKAAKRESQNVILIRGQKNILLNEIDIDLKTFSDNYGTFSAVLKSLEADKVCFVENLDSFLIAEQVIDDEYIFIHTYGGMSKTVVNKIQTNEILVFPDYDFVGLKNYLLVKSIFSNTKLFVPENYEELLATKSRTIKTNNGREQQPSKIVLESTENVVVKIREDIFKQKKFVEQQAVFK